MPGVVLVARPARHYDQLAPECGVRFAVDLALAAGCTVVAYGLSLATLVTRRRRVTPPRPRIR